MVGVEVVQVRIKKWGNSVGAIMPKSLGLAPGDDAILTVKRVIKRGRAGDGWGMLKRKGDTKKILDELNERD